MIKEVFETGKKEPFAIMVFAMIIIFLFALFFVPTAHAVDKPIIIEKKTFDEEFGVVCYTTLMTDGINFDIEKQCVAVQPAMCISQERAIYE